MAAGLRRRCRPGGAVPARLGTAACIGVADEEAAARPRPPKAQGPLSKSCTGRAGEGADYAGPFSPASRACQAVRSPSCAPYPGPPRPRPGAPPTAGWPPWRGGRPASWQGRLPTPDACRCGKPTANECTRHCQRSRKAGWPRRTPVRKAGGGSRQQPRPTTTQGVRGRGRRHVVAVRMERRRRTGCAVCRAACSEQGNVGRVGLRRCGIGRPRQRRPSVSRFFQAVPGAPGAEGRRLTSAVPRCIAPRRAAPRPPPKRPRGGRDDTGAGWRPARSMSAAPGAAGWDSSAASRAIRGQGSSRRPEMDGCVTCILPSSAQTEMGEGRGGACPRRGLLPSARAQCARACGRLRGVCRCI